MIKTAALVFVLLASTAHAAEPRVEDLKMEILQLRKSLAELMLENLRHRYNETKANLDAITRQIAEAEQKDNKEQKK